MSKKLYYPADIMLPDFDKVSGTKWAVIACDQYTSEPEYWQKAEEIRKDIHHLISVCSEYNKVYKTKTGMDTNKMKEPSVHSTPAKSQVKPMVEENATKALCLSEEIVVKSRESVINLWFREN